MSEVNSLLKDVQHEVLKVKVRYDRTVTELVKMNKFDGYVNRDHVNDRNFPAKKQMVRKEKAVLLSFPKYVFSTEMILIAMKQLNLCPGNPVQLLSVGVDYPDCQKQSELVALGQSWQSYGDIFVPCLQYLGGQRCLDTVWFDHDWFGDCRFLAFCES